MLDYKVAITGIARDSSEWLNKVLNNVNKISSLFVGPNVFIAYENDSVDNTLLMLDKFNFQNGNKIILTERNLKIPSRTERIAYARNQVLKVLHEYSKKESVDFVINIDLDNVNYEINLEEIYNSFFISDVWDVITANQKDVYYDYWALRTKAYDRNIFAPGEFYKPTFFKRYFPNLKSSKKEFNKSLREVISAFGGLAIYKYHIIKGCFYDSDNGTDCEHVLFHKCIRSKNKGRIFINPRMLNSGFDNNDIHLDKRFTDLKLFIYESKKNYLHL